MVAIKDMAIPSCCGECDFCTDNWECILLRKRIINIVGANAKHSDCPLVDIEKRKVGKWIGERGYPICEKCGCNIYEKYISCSDYAEIIEKMDFCPNCGAEMVGAENG